MINRIFQMIHGNKGNIFFFSIALFLVLLVGVSPVFTEQFDGKGYFKKGKLALDRDQLEDAVGSLLIAQKEFPLLGDYASLYLSDAYHRMGDHARSLDAARSLLRTYPESTLLKKARTAEIREAREAADGSVRTLYEAYLRDYPDDDDMAMAFAFSLKQHGETAKASAVFKNLYIRGGSNAGPALAELNTREVKVPDLLERSSNLMKRYEFREAEKDLRKALQMDDGRKKDEILRNLGQTLFRQKEYKEAAAVFVSARDDYSKARSLYRAGDKPGFERTLGLLLERNDKRAGGLLMAAAGDRRRAGDYAEAAKLYGDVLAKFPADEEEALWGIGWTMFLAADYKKAKDTFFRLSEKFDDPKYRYWQARSLEALGEDAAGLYGQLSRVDNNYYAFMSQLRGKKGLIPASLSETSIHVPSGQQWMSRVDALIELGMQKEAVYELSCSAKKVESQSDLLYIVAKFYEFGEYRKAVGLATKMPYSEKLHRFWYPLAYWDEVSGAAKRHDLDPLVALSVMREESRFDVDAKSVAGARGLMQIMPQTAYRLDKTLKLGIQKESQIHNIRNNISLGVFYLKSLSAEFSSTAHTLAAYNAGETAVRKWEQEGRYRNTDEFVEDIPYVETRNYVKKVLTSYFQYRKASPVALRDFTPGKI
ncbi:MAG: transglycosylase SLT domain-containing protein [Thermodesulfovibrionales bacterium]